MKTANETGPPEEGRSENVSPDANNAKPSGLDTALGLSVFSQHQAKLTESAVSIDVAQARGYVSADTKSQLERYGFKPAQRRVPALIIPLHGVDGQPAGYQIRPDNPREVNGRVAKYETRAGQDMVLDVPPAVQPHLGDPERPLVITEGPIKADSAVSHGIDCIALLGVWSWKGGKGKVALPDWDSVALHGREVYIAFDSDVMTKPQVQKALERFGSFLERRGAEVAYIYLPEGGQDKVGLDDWLAQGNDPDRLWDLCDSELRKAEVTIPDEAIECQPPGDPLPNARLATDHLYRDGDHLTLRYWRGDFYRWESTYWPEMPKDELEADMYRFFENAVYVKDEETVRFSPSRYKVADLLDALQAVTILPESVDPPAYVDGESPVDPARILPVANGLLDLESRRLYDHDPRFFNSFSLPYAYDPDAATPSQWLAFLDDLYPGDQESIDMLQEWFGYNIAGDTTQHKILLMLGPPRSGKGTTARILKALIGKRNFTGPTLASFADSFGLQDLVGKPVAIISDARLPRSEASVIVERLLSISGEDTLTVNRKYKDYWTGQLPTRFTILTNELPHFWDSSGAIASRFLVLRLTKTFYGNEDTQLTAKILEELPGILNWSLEGLDRLRDRGYFVQPETAFAVVQEMADLASPVGAFLRDRCEVGPGFTSPIDEIWAGWKDWCEDHGRKPGTRQVFGRDLRAKVPEISITQPRMANGKQVRHYEGLRVRKPGDPPPDNSGDMRVSPRVKGSEPDSDTRSRDLDQRQNPTSDGLKRDDTRISALNSRQTDTCSDCGESMKVITTTQEHHPGCCPRGCPCLNSHGDGHQDDLDLDLLQDYDAETDRIAP